MFKKPKIILKSNVNNDVDNAIAFIEKEKNLAYKNWFLPEHMRFVLDGKFTKQEIRKIIREYTRVYYYLHQTEINNDLRNVARQWRDIEDDYFQLINSIFDNHPWPKGGYTGLGSIFNIYPVNQEHNVFSFSYKDIGETKAVRIIAHEVLHIMFYDLLKSRYGLTAGSKIKGRDKKYIWAVAEAVNTVIENWEPYRRIVGQDDIVPYPGLEKIYARMKKQWQQKQNMVWIIDHWFKRQ